jgi:hypothetical protein
MPDPRERLRLVRSQPEQLRSREAGQRAVAGQPDQALEPDPLLDLGALGGRALVVPEDRRADHLTRLVEDDEAVHLAAPADRSRLDAEVGERVPGGAGPVVRILFGPAGPRRRERVVALGAADDLAVGESAIALTPLVPTSIPTSAVTQAAASARAGSRTGHCT